MLAIREYSCSFVAEIIRAQNIGDLLRNARLKIDLFAGSAKTYGVASSRRFPFEES
jgi:hypothetical protein